MNPPAAAQTTHQFSASDGVVIRYAQWGELTNAAPPVVLHHGFGVDSVFNWVLPGVVQGLVDAGRTVVAIDARGHGRSDKPHESSAYGEATMARDLGRLFDRLAAPTVDLVGYSMGAIVSLIAAANDARVERLVVGGVGAGVVELGGLDTRALSNLAVASALLTDDLSTITDPGAMQLRQVADMSGADRLALAAQAHAVHASPIALQAIRARTLVVAGTEDPLAVRPHVLAAAIPDATLHLVEGDHLTALTGDRFTSAVIKFLARDA